MVASLIVWMILLLLPLLPVISLYTLFQDQNFFGLGGAAKTIVATGPIAAYLVFVHVGWKIYASISNQRTLEQKLLRCQNDLQQTTLQLEKMERENNKLATTLSYVTPSINIANQLVGKWNIISESSHKRILTGNATVQFTNGVLRLNGNFYENRQPIGDWYSESAQVINDSTLVIIYSFQEQKDDQLERHQGVCTFQLGDSPITKLTGFWVVVGRTEMYGVAEYTKQATP
jgi:hypothetical protein